MKRDEFNVRLEEIDRHDEDALANYMRFAVRASPEHPVLVDRFLADAVEVDVDAICDGERVVVGGVMEHIEEAGVHSGDSACSLPPYSLPKNVVDEIVESTHRMALELGVRGLMNMQYAVKGNDVYVIEVNPRASRTVPFVSKAIGRPLAALDDGDTRSRLLLAAWHGVIQAQLDDLLPAGDPAESITIDSEMYDDVGAAEQEIDQLLRLLTERLTPAEVLSGAAPSGS